MPLYDFKCDKCGQVKEVFRPMAEALDELLCECCGEPMRRLYTPFSISNYFEPYKCPITGKPITTKTAHEENLKRHNCRILETGEREHAEQTRRRQDEKLDKAIERTTEEFVANLPGESREALAKALESGADTQLVRN